MNYNDYKEIMEFEGLEESETVKFYIKRATYCQQAIRNLKNREDTLVPVHKKQWEERKIKNIWEAIEIARFEKRIQVKVDDPNAIEKAYQRLRG